MPSVKRIAAIGAWIPCVIVLSLLAGGEDRPAGYASPFAATPTFTRPLAFDHPYFPFEPGAMNVFQGTEDDEPMTIVERHLPDVRVFEWNGQEVSCAIVEETEFEAGSLSQISYNFYAQADDGSIWFFGEFAEEFEDGELVSRSGSWLVGGPGPDDPQDTVEGDAPALHLTAHPATGETWIQENIPEEEIFERRTVLAKGRVVRVPADEFEDCAQIQEEGLDEVEVKWYAPGIGVIAVDSESEKLKLVATSIRRR